MEIFTCLQKEEGQYNTLSLTWLIPKFYKILSETKIREIRAIKVSGAKPLLKIQIMGHRRDLIELHYFSGTPALISGTLYLEVENNKNKVEAQFDFKLVKENKWQYITTLYKRDIDSYWNCFLLSSEKHLKLRLQIKMAKCEYVKELSNKNQLSSDLSNTLNTGMFTDVTVKSKEGKEFQVHKVLLASRSEVLKAPFEHVTIESQTNEIKSPFEADVLEAVISYIYTDKVRNISKLSDRLLGAADYYQLNGLKKMCEEDLEKRLSAKNVNEMYLLADSLQALTLKDSAARVIRSLFCSNEVNPEWRTEYYTFDSDE